jgi:hypothetical protein
MGGYIDGIVRHTLPQLDEFLQAANTAGTLSLASMPTPP